MLTVKDPDQTEELPLEDIEGVRLLKMKQGKCSWNYVVEATEEGLRTLQTRFGSICHIDPSQERRA
jgi:hypothetical protein